MRVCAVVALITANWRLAYVVTASKMALRPISIAVVSTVLHAHSGAPVYKAVTAPQGFAEMVYVANESPATTVRKTEGRRTWTVAVTSVLDVIRVRHVRWIATA